MQPRQLAWCVSSSSDFSTLSERFSTLIRRLGPPMSRAASFSCRPPTAASFCASQSFSAPSENLSSAVVARPLPLVARPRPLAIICAPSPARSEPWASSPAPALASAMPPRSCSTPPAATLRLRPSRPSCLTGPMLPSEESAALPSSCSGLVRLLTWAGPITSCTPGISDDPPLPAFERVEVLGVGDRPFAC